MGSSKPVVVGVDTPFLVAHTVLEHDVHAKAAEICEGVLAAEDLFGLCPTVIAEFLHVVTDARRFERPLVFAEAVEIAERWLQSRETVCLYPCDRSMELQLRWLRDHRLGRKRINDTRIASIYHQHGIRKLVTSNARDFTVFGCFEVLRLDA